MLTIADKGGGGRGVIQIMTFSEKGAKARYLKFSANGHHPLWVSCQVSGVRCQGISPFSVFFLFVIPLINNKISERRYFTLVFTPNY